MPDITQYIADQRIFAFFAGRSGSGKSAAAASLPKDMHELDFDLRIRGVKACIDQGWLNPKGISYTQFFPREGWGKVEELMMTWEAKRRAGTFPYKTISVGSLFTVSRLLINLSHQFNKGNFIGEAGSKGMAGLNAVRLSGPSDFNAEISGTHQFFDYLRSFPANVIVSGHIIDKWGKPEPPSDATPAEVKANAFVSNEVIGEKLAVRDQYGEVVLGYFDDVWRFSSKLEGQHMKYYVEFQTDLAKNSFSIPPGKFDITKREFYPFLLELIEKYKRKEN